MSTTNPYQTPRAGADIAYPQEHRQEAPSGLTSLLFSFQGRVPRRIFWGVTLAITFLFYAVIFLLATVLGPESSATAIAIMVLYLPAVWISLAIQVKRWHDRDKSGWWVLISFVPIVGPLWVLVETGCLRGTVGPNRFGADPT